MRYAGIITNDFAAAPGVCLSFFTQGCPFRCAGCHNPETWDFTGGKVFTDATLDKISRGLIANDIKRTLCVMGGEPLCPENLPVTHLVVTEMRKKISDLQIYLWTGYLYEDLQKSTDTTLQNILQQVNVLIDGPFIESEKDLTLPLRGSRNQRVFHLN